MNSNNPMFSKNNLFTNSIIVFALFIVACNSETKNFGDLNATLAKVKKEIVPDKRVAILDIDAQQENGVLLISGKSNVPDAKTQLSTLLEKENITAKVTIKSLPDKSALSDKTKAIVNISVANIRSLPKHSAELATQATLGTPLDVLEKKGNWYRVQTPDQYISWVDAGGIILMNEEEYSAWLNSKKLICTVPYTTASLKPMNGSEMVSDLAGGNVLKYLGEEKGYFKVAFPDGRGAYVKQEKLKFYDKWIEQLTVETTDLVTISKQMIGTPYLWGGTSFKGVDCSGFTKTIYFMNGMVIPRDASQQVHAGKAVDTEEGFDKLLPGDLLFFGRKATDTLPEKVVHVAMWIGNNEFIHASGRVRINSFDPKASNYNAYEHSRFLRAKRFLNTGEEKIIQLKEQPLFQYSD